MTSKAPWRVTSVKALPNYKLEVSFNDGTHGFVEMKEFVMARDAGVFTVLKDVSFFNQVHVYYGAVTWPGELDLAPDAMHEEVKKHGIYVMK